MRSLQCRSQTFIPWGPSGRQGGQSKFSKYFNLVENHLKISFEILKNNFTNNYEKFKIC